MFQPPKTSRRRPTSGPETGEHGDPLIPLAETYQRSPERGSVVVPGVRYRGDEIEAFRGRVPLASPTARNARSSSRRAPGPPSREDNAYSSPSRSCTTRSDGALLGECPGSPPCPNGLGDWSAPTGQRHGVSLDSTAWYFNMLTLLAETADRAGDQATAASCTAGP